MTRKDYKRYIDGEEHGKESEQERILKLIDKLKKKYKGMNVCGGEVSNSLCKNLRRTPIEQLFEEELKQKIEEK